MVESSKMSPEPLLQELLWPNQWQCTVACLLLNLTTRKQVDKVWPALFQLAPGPEELLSLTDEKLQDTIKSLGMRNVRSKRLRKLAKAWGTLPHRQLPGVGIYADQSNRIFFEDDLLLDEEVKDGALAKYLQWRRKQSFRLNKS